MRDCFAGPFVVKDLHSKNAVEVILTGEFSGKHPTFLFSLIKPFPLRQQVRVVIPPLDQPPKSKIILKILGEK
jgi:hypothetical protein